MRQQKRIILLGLIALIAHLMPVASFTRAQAPQSTAKEDNNQQSINSAAQTVFYAGKVKIIPPPGWEEKQSWEFGVNVKGSIPLYNRQVEGVAFIRGFDNKAELAEYRGAHDVKSLAQPAELLGSHLSASTYGWSAEASRFHLMVSGGVSVSQRGNTVIVKDVLNPGRARYLGWIKTASGQVEVLEWVSKSSLDQKSLADFALPSEFAGRKAQILYGEGVFASAAAAYRVVAARFVSPAKDSEAKNLEWIDTVLGGITPVPDSEKSAAVNQVRIRATIQEALSAAKEKNYAKALEQLQEALTLAPDDANALNLQGGILVEQGKNAEAVPILRKAIAANPDHEGAHFNLATALWNQGKKEEAVQEFEIVRRISPLFPRINETLTKIKSAP